MTFKIEEDPINGISDLTGEKWKKVRDLSSPIFSAKRMKQVDLIISKYHYRTDSKTVIHVVRCCPPQLIKTKTSMLLDIAVITEQC